ncbi:MAG: 2,3-bisphosphoglycerate-independent phosphoglycerate mutase [Bacillota bacterium]
MQHPKPLALIIMDGFGLRDTDEGNAVAKADTPFIDELYKKYPNTYLQASGEAVGLPEGQMGNSEVGHLNLGAGRVVYQDYTRINKAVKNEELVENQVLKNCINHVQEHDSSLHLMGLISDGGVHSHILHVYGLLRMAKKAGLEDVYVHVILDGRDTPPHSGIRYVKQLEEEMEKIGVGEIATVSGRYYSMDRDNRWERTRLAYDALVLGEGREADTPREAIKRSYDEEDKGDEFVEPVVITKDGSPVATVKDNDGFIFFNFRADRARQITRALGLDDFKEFERPEEHPQNLNYVCMTEYDEEFDLPIAFPPATIDRLLAEVLSENGLKQLRIAETEKYAHVTFFFNGGEEQKFDGEDRKLIPSPQEVATYDEKPEMSAYEVTDTLLGKLKKDKYDVIVLNFANPDMVGHTGFFAAAVKAVETVDRCVSKVVPAILEKGGQVLLTADHGNSEQMVDEDGKPFTAHTNNIVPFFYIGGPDGVGVKPGKLADVAPTMLDILGIEKPAEMTGESLLEKGE